jgi:hypothetical protein
LDTYNIILESVATQEYKNNKYLESGRRIQLCRLHDEIKSEAGHSNAISGGELLLKDAQVSLLKNMILE